MLDARRALLLLLAGLVLAGLAYAPGLSGPFVFDDAPNVLEPPGVQMRTLDAASLRAALTSNSSGPLGRPLAALSFALNHYAADGFAPRAFKLTNLAIHLAAALLAALFLARLLRLAPPAGRTGAAPWTLAAAAAVLWALHPVNLTSVLYVVQRMTSLSALLVLAGLLAWLVGRERLASGRRGGIAWMAGGLLLGTGLGTLAKENALLAPALAGVVEITLLRGGWRALDAPARRRLAAFWVAVLGLPSLAVLAWLALHPELITAGYAGRPFTLAERLLTQARVLWFYVSLIALPDVSRYGLYHDDFVLSTGLLHPPTTLVALGGWVAVAALGWHWRDRAPYLAFGAAWFLVGHAMESSVFPLELVHEHRNYLPALGLIAGVLVSAAALPLRGWLRVVLVASLAGVFALVTATRAFTWSDDASIIHTLYRHHPDSPAANRMMGELALKRAGNPVRAVDYYARAAELAPHETGYALWPAVLRGALGLSPRLRPEEVDALDRALATRPLTASTQYVLHHLAECARRGIPDCAGMEDTIARWLATARGVSPQGKRRRMFTISLAQLYLDTDRFERGAALMREALSEAPHDRLYLTIAANFALLRGELDAAEALLDAAAGAQPGPEGEAHVAALREALAQRRAAEAGATP